MWSSVFVNSGRWDPCSQKIDPLSRRETTIRDNDQQYQMSAPPTVKKVCKYGAILML